MKLHSFNTQFSAAHDCGATKVSEPRLTVHQVRLEEIVARTARRVKSSHLLIYARQVFNSKSFHATYHIREEKMFVKKFPKPWC